MAFGRSDTDNIYDKYIQPAIKDAGLIPIRVDRINHNDRIDERIRKEIKKSQVLVADLTYARPSVYWEAGFAEREVPVIYTCREDHLDQSNPDKYGNFIVHFDLRNANIITWDEGNNSKFRKELTKRLRFVTKGLKVDIEKRKRVDDERREFSNLSRVERRRLVTKETLQAIHDSGYNEIKLEEETRIIVGLEKIYREKSPLYWKKRGGTALILMIYPCYLSVTKQNLGFLEGIPLFGSSGQGEFLDWQSLPDVIQKLTRRSIRRVRRIKIVPILNNLTRPRIEDIFNMWRKSEIDGWYYRASFYNSEHGPRAMAMPSSTEIFFASNIQSLQEYKTHLLNSINVIEGQEHHIHTPKTA